MFIFITKSGHTSIMQSSVSLLSFYETSGIHTCMYIVNAQCSTMHLFIYHDYWRQVSDHISLFCLQKCCTSLMFDDMHLSVYSCVKYTLLTCWPLLPHLIPVAYQESYGCVCPIQLGNWPALGIPGYVHYIYVDSLSWLIIYKGLWSVLRCPFLLFLWTSSCPFIIYLLALHSQCICSKANSINYFGVCHTCFIGRYPGWYYPQGATILSSSGRSRGTIFYDVIHVQAFNL